VLVDGKAIRDGSQTIDLQPGSHEVSVYNYGYIPNTQQVHIDSKKTTDISVALQASGDKVSGPFGDIEFKGTRAQQFCSTVRRRTTSWDTETSLTGIGFGTSASS
jgi:hypothetical protein